MKEDKVYYKHDDYMTRAVRRSDIDVSVDKCIKALELEDFDSIAFRGMSGALIAPIVASRMRKEIILVRKEEENRHSCYSVEGNAGSQRYVILDDFISSGRTVSAIVKAVNKFTGIGKREKAKLVGGVFYSKDGFAPFFTSEALLKEVYDYDNE